MLVRKAFATASIATLMTAGVGMAASPAYAQDVDQDGLVNVNIQDVTIQVPIAAAANICGIDAAILAEQMNEGDVECDAQARSRARR